MMLYDQAMQFTVNAKKIWVFMLNLPHKMYKNCINTPI